VEKSGEYLVEPQCLWGMRYVPQGGGSALKLGVWIAGGANMDNGTAGSLVPGKSALCESYMAQGAELGKDIHRRWDFSTGFRELSTGARTPSAR
jgi:hypothetical protein